MPKAKGGLPYQKKSTGSIKARVDAPTRAEVGIGKKEAARSEKIAALPADERKALAAAVLGRCS